MIKRTTRFFTRLAASLIVVAIAAAGGLLVSGVASAASSVSQSAAVSMALDDHTTTTNLIVLPKSFPQDLPITLVAIVRPRAAAGSVQFKDGANNIGDPVPVIPGNVTIGGQVDPNAAAAFTITSTLAVGTHSLSAVFTPADTAAYDPSISPVESLTVTPPILTGLGRPIQSLLQSVLGGLGGARNGGGAQLGSGQLIQSILGGLHL